MKKGFYILVAALMSTTTMAAQTSAEPTRIIQEKDTVWGLGAKGVNLYERPMHRIDIAYPTTDPEGKPCTMSGVIIIPKDVYNGQQPCDGTVLYNHYTQMAKKDAPSRGNSLGEDMVLANPLSPNYIFVIPDFYGFGLTDDKNQWFCLGDANGHASLDCLLAARQLLRERNIAEGKFLINAGYSSGGYDALAAQKVRDMEPKYKEQISFDRTVVGGLPFDISEAYYQLVKNKEQVWRVFGLLMIINSYNQHCHLGYTPEQMFKSPFAEKFDEWVNSGNYATEDLIKEFKGKKLADIFQEPFITIGSDEYKKLCEVFDAHALQKGWVPDPTQKYSVFHLYKDATVPCSSGRKFLNFLANYTYDDGQANPFKKSIIPEMTNLSTNFIVPTKDHSPIGGITYYFGLTATLAALPILYYDDELNTHYADLIKGLTPIELVKMLDKKYNLREKIKNGSGTDSGAGAGSIFSLIAKITSTVDGYLEPYELTFSDLITMADDSGLSMTDVAAIYTYLTTEPSSTDSTNRAAATEDDDPLMTPFLTDYYINYLTNWYNKAQ